MYTSNRNKGCRFRKYVCFLHRSLDFQNKSNIHPGIVFGTNDDERMPKALYFLRKSHQLGNNAKMHFLDTLNKSKRIVIFGLSLIGIDFDYFKEFFESTKNCDIEVVIINKKMLWIIYVKSFRR